MESFWFDSDAQYAPIELLSGGERRRLQLLITLAKRPNVLLLDEPTNDLDLDTLRVLEDFLENFPGAVVVVSHDRAFLERTVDDVIVFDGTGTVSRLPGGYEAYERLRKTQSASTKSDSTRQTSSTPKKSKPKAEGAGRSASTIRHELRTVEKDMARLDKKRTALTAELEAAGSDHEALVRIGAELGPVVEEINGLEERWLALSEEAES
jgi:ATP-binding cassette subfamily F protein uup